MDVKMWIYIVLCPLIHPQSVGDTAFSTQKTAIIVEKRLKRHEKIHLTILIFFSIITTCKAYALYRSAVFVLEAVRLQKITGLFFWRFQADFCGFLKRGGSDLAKNYEIAILIDFYGEMLTAKQRDFLEYYYNDDLSLSEIAENEGITRQGVRDAIKRAETQLQDMENRLGMAKRFEEMREGLNEIINYSNQIAEHNLRHSLSKEINDYSVRIKAAAMTLLES